MFRLLDDTGAEHCTVVETTALVLLVVTGSAVVVVTRAVFLTIALQARDAVPTVRVKAVEFPDAMVAAVQVTTDPDLVQPGADTNVTPAGSVSVTTIVEADDGPAFAAVIVALVAASITFVVYSVRRRWLLAEMLVVLERLESSEGRVA